MSIDLSLDRLRQLVTHLPPYTRPTIHIAGTNGKGSVSALLTSILLASRPVAPHGPLRVGRYNSPHLVSILDCITIDNQPITRALYDQTRSEVEAADGAHGTRLSSFELLTLTALLAFERLKVDIVILEVGMGGRLDATNIVPTSCILASALTAVDLDHQAFLGDTVAKIAREKVGIAKPGKPFILGKQAHPEVDDVVKEVVEDVGGFLSPLVLVEKDIENDDGFSLLSSQSSPTTGQRITAYMPFFPSASPLRAQAHPEVNDVVKEVVEDIGKFLSPPVLVEKDIDDNDGGFSLLTPTTISTQSGQRITAHMPCFPSATPLRASLPLHGAHQLDNLATALSILNALLTSPLSAAHQPLLLNARITPETIHDGIEATSWPGRLSFHTVAVKAREANQVRSLLVLADGAHNPASAQTLGAYIDSLIQSTIRAQSASRAGPLPITYILGLSHSPPKTPEQTLAPLLRPILPFLSGILPSDLTAALDVRPGVALVGFTPPEGMPWVKPVPPAAIRDAVSSLLPGLAEGDILTPVDEDAASIGGRSGNGALEAALRWAAARHVALAGDSEGGDGKQVPGLIVLAGSLYLVADFYRLLEGGAVGA